MKTKSLTLLLALGVVAGTAQADHHKSGGMKMGKADVKSAGPLAFGPEGILFIGDSKGAAVYAVATGDTKKTSGGAVKVSGIDAKVAATLGTSAQNIIINDLAVNPASGAAYISVSRGRGPSAAPAIVRVSGDDISLFSLDKVKFSKATLPNAPKDGMQGSGRRASNPRLSSITDLGYVDGQVLVAGLSNEEFASNLRTIPFPFKSVDKGASAEIYHAAHGRYETRSPVRTFLAMNIGSEPHLLAAYTCTPLVKFPIKSLKPGAKIKGTTIAELGNRNRPLDMISYEKDGKNYVLMANSSRGIMKMTTDGIEKYEGLTKKVSGGGAEGAPYETVKSWQGIAQLAKLDDKHALVVRRGDSSLDLVSLALP